MPKPGNKHKGQKWHQEGRPKYNGKENCFFLRLRHTCFSEHDDRRDNTRRVSFKRVQLGVGRNKDWDTTIRRHLEDEDIDMAGMSGPSGGHARYISQRGRGRKGGRAGSPAPKRGGPVGRRKLFEGPTNWYKITVSMKQ